MTTELRVPDASCGHCKQTIEGAVSALDDVTTAELDLDTKVLRVEHAVTTDAGAVLEAVAAAGYTPERV